MSFLEGASGWHRKPLDREQMQKALGGSASRIPRRSSTGATSLQSPLDVDTLRTAARETSAILVVEDHARDGGLGEAVQSAVGSLAPVTRLAVTHLPRSGTSQELLELCGISRWAIVQHALQLAA